MHATQRTPRLTEIGTEIEAVLGMVAPHPGSRWARLQEQRRTGISGEAQFYRFHGATLQFLKDAQERALSEAQHCIDALRRGTTELPDLTEERARDCMDLARNIEKLQRVPRF